MKTLFTFICLVGLINCSGKMDDPPSDMEVRKQQMEHDPSAGHLGEFPKLGPNSKIQERSAD